ncbi:MAG: HAD family hydrolase [Anaerolineae bacterium]|nr:HAD family hydrolase [Anaerolineae bacterium]
MALRGILFDMGGTLLDYHPPTADPTLAWQAMEDMGAEALHEFLGERGYALPALPDARAASFAVMLAHWQSIGRGPEVNPQLGPLLVEVMQAWGIDGDANDLAEEAMAAYVSPVQAVVRAMPGARATLAAVQAAGLRTGLVSNTVWPGAFHLADLAQHGLLPYLEVAFFSADVAAWKPHARIFELALAALDLAPEEAVYVGDHPFFDVYGAQQVGMRGVWQRSAEWADLEAFEQPIMPDAVIDRLPDLLTVIAQWR